MKKETEHFVREDAKNIIFEGREEKRREEKRGRWARIESACPFSSYFCCVSVILTFALPAESPPFAASLLPALDAALLCFVRVFRWNRFVPLSFTPYVDVMTLFHAVRSLDNDATADRVGMVWFCLVLLCCDLDSNLSVTILYHIPVRVLVRNYTQQGQKVPKTIFH